jgi:hypothetical protein
MKVYGGSGGIAARILNLGRPGCCTPEEGAPIAIEYDLYARRPICVGSQYGTSLMRPFWRIEFWVGFQILGKFAYPYLTEAKEDTRKWQVSCDKETFIREKVFVLCFKRFLRPSLFWPKRVWSFLWSKWNLISKWIQSNKIRSGMAESVKSVATGRAARTAVQLALRTWGAS